MRLSKKRIIGLLIIVLLVYLLGVYQLPYYIQKPGGADALDPIVEVDGGYPSEGDMHLVTISGMQATPILYAAASVLPHQEILPLDQVFPEGMSQEDYMAAQLQVMESSQEAATVVAYEAAEKEIDIDFKGVYVVAAVEGLPAEGKLESGDRIIGIDDTEVNESQDLINYIDGKEAGDTVTVVFERNDEEHTANMELEPLDEEGTRVGVGINLVTDREVTVNPEIHFSSGSIGGPSAGLMFSLEIYDQLTEGDLTGGKQIGGTGEIDYDGNVHRIGGVDKKVVASDKEGVDIFFAPNENGREDSNYQVAVETAESIGTDMEIVPVDTFEDAIDYLESVNE
ncbi:SepM family pheromone-processing serine protease [Oceanobacillus jeddahense]|uniref:endopeptidase La n=1 Tax=Oceanobacillus jeddahense TaxID=1462527 RepID=A0ABY5JRZ1_9BACI|nr:SepM family pheromone-processing serine protease [Oceanobacillus jeddahense]UUI01642.1 PDZ domain-containing protein [Oceanobacillus jeddahense]